MTNLRKLTAALLGTVGLCLWGGAGLAADLGPGVVELPESLLPAVSGVNGKWEVYGGLADADSAGLRAAGSLSLPLGERFGAQGDVMIALTDGEVYLAGAGHVFTRDPSRYLVGVTAGVVSAPGANLGAAGVEGELYLGQWSLEAWAGVAAVDYSDPALDDVIGVFAIGDVAYYPTDDLRLAFGLRRVLDETSLRLSGEYQLSGLPMSLTADARLRDDGGYSAMFGIKGYFGADEGKSLADRHRQDDPPNRALDLFAASVGTLNAEASGDEEPIPDTEEACIANQQDTASWYWDSFVMSCFPLNPG